MIDVCFGILMDLLNKRKVTARYLAGKYEISARTVYRYLDTLSHAGVPVFCTRGRNGGISVADNYRLPAALLTDAERERVLSGLSLLKAARPDADVESIRNKFAALNAGSGGENPVLAGDRLVMDGTIGDGKLYLMKINPLTKAMDDCLVTKIVYRDRGGETTERFVHPHAFVLKDMVWYLYAFCELRQSFRMFKVSRIEKLAVLDRRFERKPRSEFTPWKLDFGGETEIVDLLMYVSEEARYDAEEWLGVECVKPQRHGKYPYLAAAEVADGPQLLPRLMSFGAGVKIVNPPSLERRLRRAAEELAECYLPAEADTPEAGPSTVDKKPDMV